MSLLKPVTLTPAKLAANRANARRSTGPRTAQGQQRERALLSSVAQWWYADEAAHAVYGGEPTNPQCPLESTDRNSDSSLFPFQWRLSPSRLRRLGPDGEKPWPSGFCASPTSSYSMPCTNEPTMLREINRLANQMVRYSRFKAGEGRRFSPAERNPLTRRPAGTAASPAALSSEAVGEGLHGPPVPGPGREHRKGAPLRPSPRRAGSEGGAAHIPRRRSEISTGGRKYCQGGAPVGGGWLLVSI